MRGRSVVLGVGNVLNRDEGLGVHALRLLEERMPDPAGVELIDGGVLGLNLLPMVEECDRLLVLDAIDRSEEPGTLIELDRDEIPLFAGVKMSQHQITLQEVLGLASDARQAAAGASPGRPPTGRSGNRYRHERGDRIGAPFGDGPGPADRGRVDRGGLRCMREASVRGLIETAVRAVEDNGNTPATGVTIVVGDLTGIDDESVRTHFEVMSEGTPVYGVPVTIEHVAATAACFDCAHSFEATSTDVRECPECKSGRVRVAPGPQPYVSTVDIAEGEA